jgi:tRNA pseudouridine38-40 synthase
VPDVFSRRYAWHVPGPLDVPAMQRASQGLVGTHDFRSFEASGAGRRTSVRTIADLDVCRGRGERRDFVFVEIQADGFLYHMVRTIVGTLVEVGRGARSEDWPTEVMQSEDRQRAGPTAPAHGLFLVSVQYERSS